MEKEALAGLKVADFGWVIAGPLITKCLGDHGATVVRVEANSRPCLVRTTPPYKDGKAGLNRAGYFAYVNPNKYSITIDLNNAKGIEVAKKLVGWSDVVVENFTPRQMERWGLSYEELKRIKPDIIMVRSSNQGQTGPHASFAALGLSLTGLAGFPEVTGWPDRSPLPLPMAYSDFVSPRFGVAALLAALDYRRRTGKGQCIDLSQVECGIHFLAPMMLDYVANSREPNRLGNSCPYAAPHGVYRCKGEDRWCALAVFTDEEWQAFCRVLGNPGWTRDSRFTTMLSRKENEAKLNKLIEEWTENHAPEEVMVKVQQAGVAAAVVKNAKDVYEDPQLRHRGFLWLMEHGEIGSFTCFGQPFELSKTPAKLKMPSPLLGEHTEYVCTNILQMADQEFIELWQSGAFG